MIPAGTEAAPAPEPKEEKLPEWMIPAEAQKPRSTLETIGDMGMTGLSHAYDTAAMGLAPDLEEAKQQAITGGTFSKNAPPPGALKANLVERLTEGAKRNPYSAAAGDIAGFVAGAGTAGIPKVLGLAGKVGGGFLRQRLGRAALGGLFGGATSGLQTLASTHDPEVAWDAAKQGAGWGAAAFGAPELTAPVMVGKGAINDNRVESAAEILNGLTLGTTTYAGKARHLGKPLEYAGQSARDAQTIKLIRELLPKETAEVKARNALGEETIGARNKAAETKVTNAFKEAQESKSPVSASPVRQGNEAAQQRLKEIFSTLQSDTSPVSASPVLKEARTTRANEMRSLKERASLLKRSTSPVGGEGGTGSPSIPGQPDLMAQAMGKLGSKVQENFRFLRSKGDLGLELTPEAEAGAKAILPDYQAQANTELGEFAGGKAAVLQKIVAALKAERGGGGGGGGPADNGFFMRPDLLPTTGTLKPNPLAGLPPKPAPLPAYLGLEQAPTSPLKPNPIAPFPAPKPPLPPNMGLDVGLEGIKLNPKAGFTPEVYTPEPLPTAESIAPKAAEGVNTRLLQMRQEQGIPSRIASRAARGFLNPLSGRTFFGAAEALVKDPVLATSVTEPVGKALSKVGAAGDRYSKFLAGATGPLLQKKLEFLMRTDPEFKAQVEASNGQ